ENLVLRMVEPVRALRAVWVRSLQVGIRSDRETNPGHWITSLKKAAAAGRLCRRGPPRLYKVVDERVIRPLRNLVAKRVDILETQGRAAVRPSEQARRRVRAPGEGLHRLITVAVLRAVESVGWHVVPSGKGTLLVSGRGVIFADVNIEWWSTRIQ